MHLHQLLITSFLSGFLGGLIFQIPAIFFRWNSFRWESLGSLGIVFSMVSSGLIWGVAFLILSFIFYSNEVLYPKEQMGVLFIRLGITLPLGSAAFELCYAAVRRFRANRNRESNGSDLD